TQRRALVQGWANILRAIEQSYDPTFDVEAHLSCPVPLEANGQQSLPCSDPSVIQDRRARVSYAASLAAYRSYVHREDQYERLGLLDRRAMSILEMSLDLFRKVAPRGTQPDFVALDRILEQAGITLARRTKIDAMLHRG